MIRHCTCCGKPFEPRPQVPDQAFCSSPDCQRARKRQWQQAKLQSDPDYRINQCAAQQAWSQRNQDYWRNYRDARPEYAQCNREQQRSRDQGRNVDLAKMDVCDLPSGLYLSGLIIDEAEGIAHALLRIAPRKDVLAMPGQSMQVAQNGNGLRRQWNKVFSLRLGHEVAPLGLVKIEAAPFGFSQFARSHEEQRRKPERALHDERTLEPIYGAQQFRNAFRLDNGSEVHMLGGR